MGRFEQRELAGRAHQAKRPLPDAEDEGLVLMELLASDLKSAIHSELPGPDRLYGWYRR